jgi:CRISPR-associated protein Cas1
MATLYVTEQGARLEKEYRRLLVVKEETVLLAAPLGRVDHVVLVGNVGVTTPALHALLDAEIGVTLLNRWGDLRGQLHPGMDRRLAVRRQQYTRGQEAAFCLAFSRAVVQGKLRNLRNLARKLVRSGAVADAAPIELVVEALASSEQAGSLETLRGLEGIASRAWFALLRQALDHDMGFTQRIRRPPTDPINAMLSLGYTLLTQNMMTACEIVGLDPYEGYFHADSYGRPALALDLIEEFRACVVDSTVLRLVNRDMVDATDFMPGPEGGLYLKPGGLRTFFQAYTARLQNRVIHPAAGRALSYQKCFEVQARLLRKVIEGELAHYTPFLVR